jgi:large subunit ribosomal protein L25
LLREVDREPITTRIRHVSLWAMAMDEPIETEVPIVLEGESLALKSGGVLIHPVEKLRVKCLPTQIPEAIHVTSRPLESFGDSIHLRDIQLPAGVQALDDPDTTIASVAPPKGVAEEEVPEETVGEELGRHIERYATTRVGAGEARHSGRDVHLLACPCRLCAVP